MERYIDAECLISAGLNEAVEGSKYVICQSDYPYKDTFWIEFGSKGSKHHATYDVWKAPSGVFYILKRHCQPESGVLAIFKEV